MTKAAPHRQCALLDRVLPLRDASHADAARYDVDIPMRYSELRVTLKDGRVVRLRRTDQFLGWQGLNGSRRLLFRCGESLIEIDRSAGAAAVVRELQGEQRIVTRDGNLQTIPSADAPGGAGR